ncbi:MAG: hypothetical protein U9N87_10940, partial [Planctomycetota bacterium]|nr:hypothetical protein [Planctomycetota bacterium]
MADRSAVALGDVLLAVAPTDQTAHLSDALASDPTFLLWAVCVAARDGLVPQRVDDVAAWLAAGVPDVLDWPSPDDARPPGR